MIIRAIEQQQIRGYFHLQIGMTHHNLMMIDMKKTTVAFTICCFLLTLNLFSGCSKKRGAWKPKDNFTPHTEVFKSTTQHGTYHLKNRQLCTPCHGSDFRGGTSKKDCQTCHYYPHSLEEGWSRKEVHGAAYMAKGTRADDFGCVRCHEKRGDFNTRHEDNFRSCSECHVNNINIPHSKEEFVNAPKHGSEFLKDSRSCTPCHGQDYEGGNTEVACQSCHYYPHRELWTLPRNHGAAYKATGSNADEFGCLKCHEESSGFKNRHRQNFLVCNSCHLAFPHTFERTEDIENYVDQHKEDAGIAKRYEGKCTLCHKNLTAPLPNNSGGCAPCHDEDEIPVFEFRKAD
ncbi:hypothetical protein ACFLRA_01195 [Bdellovibrionota bacterium]